MERLRAEGPDGRERERALEAEVARLRRRLRRLDAVASALEQATFWDHAAYEQVPGPEWVAIDREDAARLLAALDGDDRWRPWRAELERRPVDGG